jgi:hypothetical protein
MLQSLWGKTPQPAPPPPVVEPKVTYRLVVAPDPVEDVAEVALPLPLPEPESEIEPPTGAEKMVLLGVKVRPDTKKTLMEMASIAGVTLSSYVRSVLEKICR